MKTRRIAAVVYATLTGIVVAFQLALAVGAPWGAYAMAGAYPGQFPPGLRVTAGIQALVLIAFAAVVLSRAAVSFTAFARASRWLIWVVVVLCALSVLLNLITPSGGERMVWAPVALTLLTTSLLVATGPQFTKPAA